MKIILATDAWEPQINGVARTLKNTEKELVKMGHEVNVLQPEMFKTINCPYSKDVKLGFVSQKYLKDFIKNPCAVHIATEGTIGLATRIFCKRNNIPFTTAYHTKYPEYVKKYAHIPLFATRAYMRWFHNSSSSVMATTEQLANHIKEMGINSPIKIWGRGVDDTLFYQRRKNILFEKPVGMYVGRISKEKSIEDFLELPLNIIKIVVGDGPELKRLESNYPDVIFTGPLVGEELASMYCNADVFVFPSKTDTFGLVVLEALASGVPVACYPVKGPGEIISKGENIGCASWDLKKAFTKALTNKNEKACVEFAKKYSWKNCTQQFYENLILSD
jgi:glycosyltransferase involved in cell wall biosynthesis